MAFSSVEAEYMEVSQAASEAIWMRNILVVLFGSQMDLIVIQCDNQSFIKSRLILCFMIGPSTYISSTIILDIVCKEA